MIPELGFVALLFALVIATLLAIIPQIGIAQKKPHLIGLAWNFSYLFIIFTCISISCLAYSFAVDDFSVEYVSAHSNSQLPLFFKIAATWGGHEGSMLFWLFSLGLWLAAFAFFSRRIDPIISARTQSILGLICLSFCIFIVFFSNPFIRQFPLPPEGRDLNPMLQDIGLILHPPLLYLGYVGFAVNFSITLAAMLNGHLDAAISRWTKPWVLVSWFFLTLGIGLGAWWAYYELGWGGWWFWDPVENASLMPWLLGLALLHSLNVTEKRGIFGYWTILFSLFTFAFSLLGTFIVRSGVLTSVHAFAVDGERGTILLLIFFILMAAALTIFALKLNLRQSAVRFAVFSKESLLLVANIIFAIATVSVFVGTFYPMVYSSMGWGSISVGAPYFNSIFLPLLVLMLVAMIFVLVTKWQKSDRTLFIRKSILLLPALLIAYGLIYFALAQEATLKFNLVAFLLLSLAIWLLLATLWTKWSAISLKYFAMILAHCGVAVAVIGAVMSSYFGSEIGVRLAPNQIHHLSGFDFHYLGFSNELGPNFTAEKAHFEISQQGKVIAHLYPERRYYEVRTMNMSEVGIKWGMFGDIYIVMGDKISTGEFSFRLHYKPFVGWLWLGGILMAFGALIGAIGLKRKPKVGNENE